VPSAFGLVAFFCAVVRFLAEVAFFPDLPLVGATRGFRGATLAFLVAFGSLAGAVAWVDSWFSVMSVVIVVSPLRLITAVTTSITLVGNTSKRILLTIGKGDGMAMGFQTQSANRR
jgi:hypothetical protein